MDELLDFDLARIEDILKNCKQLSDEVGWIDVVPNRKEANVDKNSIIHSFKINKKSETIYSKIEGLENLELTLEELDVKINTLKEKISKILTHYESKVDENTNIAINSIYKSITNFGKVSSKQLRKISVEEIDNIDELKEEFAESLAKLLESRFIGSIISPIYEGIKNTNLEVYENLIVSINNFLEDLGVYTIDIEEGKEVDYKYIQPMESDKNITTDYTLEEKIMEVYQYPYVFDNEHVIAEGKVVLWRLR